MPIGPEGDKRPANVIGTAVHVIRMPRGVISTVHCSLLCALSTDLAGSRVLSGFMSSRRA